MFQEICPLKDLMENGNDESKSFSYLSEIFVEMLRISDNLCNQTIFHTQFPVKIRQIHPITFL